MKLKNLLFMPVAVALDIATLGTLECTDRLRASDRSEREVDATLQALEIIAKIKNGK